MRSDRSTVAAMVAEQQQQHKHGVGRDAQLVSRCTLSVVQTVVDAEAHDNAE
jgi:hypothetical protein